uniref:Uncharacterized protein n=1 Tax=viral metagenome TaxID=1070528 RepID=A0A6C0LJW1_9ZZZZ
MTSFFFYNKLTNVDLIKQINTCFEICDGFIIIHKYDRENNVLEISDDSLNNNKTLTGKIVTFNMGLNDIIKKIGEIEEVKTNNNPKCTLKTIWVNKPLGGKCKTYIIY